MQNIQTKFNELKVSENTADVDSPKVFKQTINIIITYNVNTIKTNERYYILVYKFN